MDDIDAIGNLIYEARMRNWRLGKDPWTVTRQDIEETRAELLATRLRTPASDTSD